MNGPNLKLLFYSASLTKRQKYCIAVAALYAAGLRDDATAVIEKAVTADRMPRRLFSELFIHLSLFLGFPTMLEGLERLKSINSSNMKEPKLNNRRKSFGKGMRVFQKVYGDQTKKVLLKLGGLHKEVVLWIIQEAYGRVFTRSGLSLGERELVNVVVLGIQGFTPQFFSHLRGALRVGVSSQGAMDTLNCIASCSRIEKRASLRMLNQITRMMHPRKPSIDFQT